MGDVGRFHFLGLIVSRDSFMNKWEVIQPAEEGSWKLATAGSVLVRMQRIGV